MPGDRTPPRLGRWLLRLCRLGSRRAEVEADLIELFRVREISEGPWTARWKYLTDVLSLYGWCANAGPRASGHTSMTTGMAMDIVFAFRLFRRHPGLFGVTTLGPAAAIGISTAVVSVTKATAFRGYGVADPASVRRVTWMGGVSEITGDSPRVGQWAFEEYSRVRASTATMTLVGSVASFAPFRTAVNGGTSEPVRYMAVSGDYFTVLGMRASLGRLLSPNDDRPGSATIVVSHGFWKNTLGADADIVGRTIWLGARAYSVVGVADRRHSAPGTVGLPPALWISLAAEREAWSAASAKEASALQRRMATLKKDASLDASARDRYATIEKEVAAPPPAWNPAIEVRGRLRAGATLEQAGAELDALAAGVAEAKGLPMRRPAVRFESAESDASDQKIAASILVMTVSLVLLIACANVTNILLANAASRRREIGTRLAIGASRARLLRQLLTESVLIGVVASAAGLGIAIAIIPTLAALSHTPEAVDVSPDAGVYVSLAIMTVAVGIFAGLAPARYAQGQDLTTTLKTDQVAAPMPLPRAGLRSILIATQAAVSAVLLVLAALLTRSLIEASTADVGYDLGPLMTIAVGDPTGGVEWTATQQRAYWEGLLGEVARIPGVASAALTVAPPFDRSFFPAQRIGARTVERNEVSPEYFTTVGIPFLQGRTFSAQEAVLEEPVAIVSASLARAVWRSRTALGKDLDDLWGTSTADERRLAPIYKKPIHARVIGVVPDITTRVGEPQRPTLYLPIARTSFPELMLRTGREPGALIPSVRERLRSFDPRLDPVVIFPGEERQRQMQRPRLLATLSLTVGLVALGLAVIGLFGVTAFVVQQRTHELSVRRALGATYGDLVTMLCRESLRPVIVGLSCGVFLSLAGGRLLQSVLHGVTGRDPIAIVSAVALLMVAATGAVILPVRRAALVNLAQLLKLG
jgi:predicted permease